MNQVNNLAQWTRQPGKIKQWTAKVEVDGRTYTLTTRTTNQKKRDVMLKNCIEDIKNENSSVSTNLKAHTNPTVVSYGTTSTGNLFKRIFGRATVAAVPNLIREGELPNITSTDIAIQSSSSLPQKPTTPSPRPPLTKQVPPELPPRQQAPTSSPTVSPSQAKEKITLAAQFIKEYQQNPENIEKKEKSFNLFKEAVQADKTLLPILSQAGLAFIDLFKQTGNNTNSEIGLRLLTIAAAAGDANATKFLSEIQSKKKQN